MNYFIKTLLGLDQFANTIIGGAPDETISARAGRLRNRFFWKQLAWTLDHIQTDHTAQAIAHERDGSQQSEAYKDVYEKLAEAKEAVQDTKQAVKEVEKALDEVAK